MGALTEGWGTVERWLGRLAPITARQNLFIFKAWMKWVGEKGSKFSEFSPDDLVEHQKNVDNGSRFDILDLAVQPYVTEKEGRKNYKLKIYSTIRSFFRHNRADLPTDSTFIIRPEKEKGIGTLTIGEVKNLILSSNPTYQAIFLSMFQGGMDRESFEYWNNQGYQSLREQLRQDPDVVRVELPGRKMGRNERLFYTYIGSDAIKTIRNYLGDPLPTRREAIFLDKNGEPVSKRAVYYYWLRHLRKLGLIPPSKGTVGGYQTGKNPHELRDLFRTQWEKSPAKISVAEYCMGHVVDPLEYNKAYRDHKWTKNEYLKAVSMLNIMSSDRPFGKVDQDEVRQLRVELEDAKEGRTSEMEAMRAEIEELRKERRRDDVLLELLLDAAKENPDLIDTLLRRKAQET